jgi:hypothetical protein
MDTRHRVVESFVANRMFGGAKMRRRSRINWRIQLLIGVTAVTGALGAYIRFGVMRRANDDRGYERSLRRWTPVAAEFRARQIRLARLMIRTARVAERAGILSPSGQQSIETNALRIVRFESRPVYTSGRRGEWGDTGARWSRRAIG